jgi:predicted nucleic acid-binding protein
MLSGGRKPRIHDTWIAATALVNDAEVLDTRRRLLRLQQAVTVVRV